MAKETDILFELIGIWANENELYSKQGTVKSIDLNERTCIITPTDGGPDILDVYLEADSGTSGSKGFFVVPAVGSIVVATFINSQEAFLTAWTAIDNVVAKSGEWVFNDGDNGGLVKVKELTERINELEALFSQLKTDLSTWIPSPTDGGSALKVILTSGFLTKPVPSSTKNEFENLDVKH